jgi:hypothetical protein
MKNPLNHQKKMTYGARGADDGVGQKPRCHFGAGCFSCHVRESSLADETRKNTGL